MSKWKQTIKIKDLLSDDDDAATIKHAADELVSRLPASAPTARIVKAKELADADAETALLVFNDGLNRIYDWADANRVWLA